MVSYIFKRSVLRIREMAFGSFEDLSKNREYCDVIYMHSNDTDILRDKKWNLLVKRQATLVNNLEQDQESIFNNIKKNCRYEIRRAEREECKATIFTSQDLKLNIPLLDDFQSIYNGMFEAKGLNGYSFNRKLIMAGIENCNIVISMCEDKENKYKVFHAYLTDGSSCVLVYSASSLWNEDDKQAANLIGWMNKYLHWKDMCFFKSNDFTRYEWGGISSIQEPNGIDKFKMEFGGETAEFNNYIAATSILGKAYLFLVSKR